MEQTEPITYSAYFRRMAGGRSDRHTKDAKLRLIQLKAKKLACFSQASNELIADGMSFEEMLAGALIKGLGWYMDYAFINGTGEVSLLVL